MRRAIEFLPETAFSTKTYCRLLVLCFLNRLCSGSSANQLTIPLCVCADEKWAAAIATTMIERATISQPELDAALGKPTEKPPVM